MAEEKKKLTSTDVMEALVKRWPPAEYVHIPEAPMSSDRQGRKLDLVVVSMWKSRGLALDGVEIKVSMSDWKRELEGYTDGSGKFHGGPDKAEWWWHHVNRFWIAAPAEIAKKIKPQLPPTWGLLSVNDGGTARVLVAAPVNRKREDFTWGETVGLLRALNGTSTNMLHREFQRGRSEGYEEAQKALSNGRADRAAESRLTYANQRADQLQEAIKAFEETSGIKISQYPHEAGNIGSIVALVREAIIQGPNVVDSRLAAQAEQMRAIADQVDKVRGALSGAVDA